MLIIAKSARPHSSPSLHTPLAIPAEFDSFTRPREALNAVDLVVGSSPSIIRRNGAELATGVDAGAPRALFTRTRESVLMRISRMLLAAATVAIAACEPQSSGETLTTDTAATPAINAAAPGNVVATLGEWEVVLTGDTIPAGEIAFQVMNRGNEMHRFEIEGGGQEWVSDSLMSNGETMMRVRLEPGTYEVYCPVESAHGVHKALGMVDTLVVR